MLYFSSPLSTAQLFGQLAHVVVITSHVRPQMHLIVLGFFKEKVNLMTLDRFAFNVDRLKKVDQPAGLIC